MSVLAVYIVPRTTDPLYQVGTSFLGYDVRTGERFSPLLSDRFDPVELKSWIGRARTFGFHATLGDALEYAEDSIPEVKARLEYIATCIPPFTLINGRFHDTFRNVPRTLAVTFDSPDGELERLHHLVVTMVNVLYCASPYYEPKMDSFAPDDSEYFIRYGVPHLRILDRFDLHFSFATSIPDRRMWEVLKEEMIRETGLLLSPNHHTLMVDEIHLLERGPNGYFRLAATFPLKG